MTSPDAQARLKAEGIELLDAATYEQIMRANDAVAANLDEMGVPKYDSAFGYSCALTAIMQTDTRTPDAQPSSTEGEVERVAFEIASSLWGKAQAETFFKLRERNAHFGLAVNAARAAIAAQMTKP